MDKYNRLRIKKLIEFDAYLLINKQVLISDLEVKK